MNNIIILLPSNVCNNSWFKVLKSESLDNETMRLHCSSFDFNIYKITTLYFFLFELLLVWYSPQNFKHIKSSIKVITVQNLLQTKIESHMIIFEILIFSILPSVAYKEAK